jgi:hypothetical protein
MPAGRWHQVLATGKVPPIPTPMWRKSLPHDRLKADRACAHHAAGLVFLAITSVGWGFNWPVTKYLLSELPVQTPPA